MERRGDLEELNGHGRGRGGGGGRREERGTEVEENVEKGGKSYCGRVLRWCNPHLLRGRLVIVRGERETGA